MCSQFCGDRSSSKARRCWCETVLSVANIDCFLLHGHAVPCRARDWSEACILPSQGSAVVGAHVASAAGDTQDQDKPLFRKVPRIQFIAALGDPAASSGIGADKWGLWVEDPGPRGVYLDRFAKLQRNGGKAPAGWKYDSAGRPSRCICGGGVGG
jgi:hypothetical protein